MVDLLAPRKSSGSLKRKPQKATQQNGEYSFGVTEHKNKEFCHDGASEKKSTSPRIQIMSVRSLGGDSDTKTAGLLLKYRANETLMSSQQRTPPTEVSCCFRPLEPKISGKKFVSEVQMLDASEELRHDEISKGSRPENILTKKQSTSSTKVKREKNAPSNTEPSLSESELAQKTRHGAMSKNASTFTFAKDETPADLHSSSVKPKRKGNRKANSVKEDMGIQPGEKANDQHHINNNRSGARDVSSAPIFARQSSVRNSRIARQPMPQRQKSDSVLCHRPTSMKVNSERNLLPRSSNTLRIEKGSTQGRKMHKQRSETAISTHNRSEHIASTNTTNTTEKCKTPFLKNWKGSGEINQHARPAFRKQISEAFLRSCDGLKDTLQKRITCQQLIGPSKEKKEEEKLDSTQLTFRRLPRESSLGVNTENWEDTDKAQSGRAVPEPRNEFSKPGRARISTLPKNALEQKLMLAWRKQTIQNALQCDDESAVTEYMKLIEEKYGEKMDELTTPTKTQGSEYCDDMSAITDYMNMIEATYGDPNDHPPSLRAPLEILDERTDRDESEATFHMSVTVASDQSPAQEARRRRASLSNYLGSSFDAPVHGDGSELATLGRTKARRASLSDYIAYNEKSSVSIEFSLMTIASNETG